MKIKKYTKLCKQDARSCVKEHLANQTKVGVEFRLVLDNGNDWRDVAVFKMDYIFGMLHIMAGIEEYGMVEIKDVSGWMWDLVVEKIDKFVDDYFKSVDLLEECYSYYC